MYIPIQNGIDNEITAGDINNTEENCKNFNVNLSTRKTGVAERNKIISDWCREDRGHGGGTVNFFGFAVVDAHSWA